MKLRIQLIPKKMYKKNVRTRIDEVQWRQISRLVRNNAEGICDYCGEFVGYHDLEAHEEWEYVKRKKNGKILRIQRLKRIVAACKKCHAVAHLGRTFYEDGYDEAVDHFMQVNNCTYSEFKKHKAKMRAKYQKRSKHKWRLDINIPYLEEILGEKIIEIK